MDSKQQEGRIALNGRALLRKENEDIGHWVKMFQGSVRNDERFISLPLSFLYSHEHDLGGNCLNRPKELFSQGQK